MPGLRAPAMARASFVIVKLQSPESLKVQSEAQAQLVWTRLTLVVRRTIVVSSLRIMTAPTLVGVLQSVSQAVIDVVVL